MGHITKCCIHGYDVFLDENLNVIIDKIMQGKVITLLSLQQRAKVPKFGNWESEDNVPYTVYFEKARQGKTGGKMINPNDPQENPDMFPDIPPPAQAPPSRTRNEPEEPTGRRAVRSHEERVSREDGEFRQSTESPARNENLGRGSTQQRRGGHGSGSGRPARQSAGSEYSIERSPLHPQFQAKIAEKGSGSPAGYGKNSYDNSHGTPGRSRMKPVESPDRGAAVPRFGEWDENNPSSADNYTHIFNKVRQERQTSSPNVTGRDTEPSYATKRKEQSHDDHKSCCFPWSRK
ncbi:hypothetical protein RJ639_021471 [Escallonia herrerae]|uniref:RIN4 pathogenic type III effector avirulence factor Avr cleavage site domain-containing protein n=1 Tax=Escallonia herrerae TaxID=1293975 RepID=A0AA88V4J8_9ASTE|nr:hypothetical protein RJ639_021471 [Escallonia herrerae]